MKSKDQQLLEEAYQQINVNKYKQTRLSQIVSVINESDYSINEREKLLKYVSENADSVIELCEQGGWDKFTKTLKTKVAPYALAATAALGGHKMSQAAEVPAPAPNQTAITQAAEKHPELNKWIAELEMWKKIFSTREDAPQFQDIIDSIKHMDASDKERYETLVTSTTLPGTMGRPNQSQYGTKADARAHMLRVGSRFLKLEGKPKLLLSPAARFARQILYLSRNTTPEKLQEIYNHFEGKQQNGVSASLRSKDDISYIMDVLKGVPQQ